MILSSPRIKGLFSNVVLIHSDQTEHVYYAQQTQTGKVVLGWKGHQKWFIRMLELLLFWLMPRVQQQRKERCLQVQTDMGGAQKASTQASASLRLYGSLLVLIQASGVP